MTKRKVETQVEFKHAVSVIIDRVTVARLYELEAILIIQHDLLKLTLNCINEKRGE